MRQRIKFALRQREPRERGFHLRGVAGKFLAQGDRRRIHRMGAADLDDPGEFLGLLVERRVQVRERRHEMPLDLHRRGDVHGGRDRIVRRLAHVDVIVRMHRRFRAELAAKRDIGGVGDHFIDVHVGLRARAGLPNQQRKMPVELAVGDILRHRGDGRGAPAVERAQIAIDLGRGALDQAERAHDLDRHALGADAEIMQRAFGLRAPKPVGGNFQRPECVAFGAGFDGFLRAFGHDSSMLPRSSRASYADQQIQVQRIDARHDLFLAEAVEPDHFAAATGRLVGLLGLLALGSRRSRPRRWSCRRRAATAAGGLGGAAFSWSAWRS